LAPFRLGEDEFGSLNLERYINGEQPFQDDRLVTPLETIQIEFSDEGPRYDPALAYHCYGLVFELFHRRLGSGDLAD
jgi:hypothetical protein